MLVAVRREREDARADREVRAALGDFAAPGVAVAARVSGRAGGVERGVEWSRCFASVEEKLGALAHARSERLGSHLAALECARLGAASNFDGMRGREPELASSGHRVGFLRYL